MGVKGLFFVVLFSAIVLIGCSTESTTTCLRADCPKLDCTTSPLKTETKIETKTVTNTIYICSDLREVRNKDDCLNLDSGGWYDVKTFSGSNDRTTETFNINSKRWRYTMSCSSQYGGYNYNLQINKLINDETSLIKAVIMQKCESETEPSYIYDGPGEYFFEITSANIESWTIRLEAQK